MASINTVPNMAWKGLSFLQVGRLVPILLGLFITWRLIVILYRLTFHPLARFPGPKHYAITNLPFIWNNQVRGNLAHTMVGMYQQYGPIVRISPNRLSVDGSVAWPQVFQHKVAVPEWPKVRDFFFDDKGESLVNGTKENHRRLRKHLAPGFSMDSVYRQEEIVQKYVELFIQRLSEVAAAGQAFDIVQWLNFTTYDIIGDLVFGESFHNLETGRYHEWVLAVFDVGRGGALRQLLLQYSFLLPLVMFLPGSTKAMKERKAVYWYAVDRAMARKALGETPGGRQDFMTFALKRKKDGQPSFSDRDITLNFPTLFLAGSDTMSTAMAGLLWHLGRPQNRKVYETLRDEIRQAFASEAEMDMKSYAALPYLMACIKKGLRVYPPAAESMPRVSPGAELNSIYIPQGFICITFQHATYRNPANFHEPSSFRPERWLPSSHKLYNPAFEYDNKEAFRPFSFGTRDCLARNFAYSEMRVIISRLLYRFNYEAMPGQDRWQDDCQVFVGWQKQPFQIKLIERSLANAN